MPELALMPGLALMLALIAALGGCAASSEDAADFVCRAEDGRGNVFESTNFEMLTAAEVALQQCETMAADPTTCVARGCRGR